MYMTRAFILIRPLRTQNNKAAAYLSSIVNLMPLKKKDEVEIRVFIDVFFARCLKLDLCSRLKVLNVYRRPNRAVASCFFLINGVLPESHEMTRTLFPLGRSA